MLLLIAVLISLLIGGWNKFEIIESIEGNKVFCAKIDYKLTDYSTNGAVLLDRDSNINRVWGDMDARNLISFT